ncbi:MAG: prepilin-type N-terminal cleavage/methylation domain-containing protein [Pseudomonadota bacterium]
MAFRFSFLKLRSRAMKRGFSLVELSVVVSIMSVVSVMGLEGAANFINRTSGAVTKDRLAVVDTAIARFFRIYGRLPCPAARTAAPLGSTSYGLEDCSIGTFATGTNYASLIGGGLMSGAVPFRTLNLPMSTSLDGFSSKINYVVTKNMTLAGTTTGRFGFYDGTNATTIAASGVGGIQIRTGVLAQPCNTGSCNTVADPTTTPPDGAAYIVFSSGSDKRGAYSANGVATTACIPTPTAAHNSRVDSQNCVQGLPGTNTVSVSNIPNNVFYDNRYNAGLNLTNYFDDYVIWRKRSQL